MEALEIPAMPAHGEPWDADYSKPPREFKERDSEETNAAFAKLFREGFLDAFLSGEHKP